MGSSNSKGNAKKVTYYDPQVETIRIVDDPNYGRVKLVREVNSSTQMILKEIACDTKQVFEEESKFFETRVLVDHPNIVRVIGFNAKNTSKYCSTFYKINVFIEILTKELNEVLRENIKRKASFPESQVLLIAENVISAGAFLQSHNHVHGDIRPINIFVYGENNILTDPKLEIDRKSNGLIKAIINKQKTYLSPQLLSLVPEAKYEHAFNPVKNDVYSLGVTLLSVATLTNGEDLYNYENGTIDERLVNERLREVKSKYSPFTYTLIRDMLVQEETTRPDFVQLAERVAPYAEDIKNRIELPFNSTNQSMEREIISQAAGVQENQKRAVISRPQDDGPKKAVLQSKFLKSQEIVDDEEDIVVTSERNQREQEVEKKQSFPVVPRTVHSEYTDRLGDDDLELQIQAAIERSRNTYKVVQGLNNEEANFATPGSRSDLSTNVQVPAREYTSYTTTTVQPNVVDFKYEPERVVRSVVTETRVEPTTAPVVDDHQARIQEILNKYKTPSADTNTYQTSTYTSTIPATQTFTYSTTPAAGENYLRSSNYGTTTQPAVENYLRSSNYGTTTTQPESTFKTIDYTTSTVVGQPTISYSYETSTYGQDRAVKSALPSEQVKPYDLQSTLAEIKSYQLTPATNTYSYQSTTQYPAATTTELRKSGYGNDLRKSGAAFASQDNQIQQIYNELRKSQVIIPKNNEVVVPVYETVTVVRSSNDIGGEPLRKSGVGSELRKSQAPLASADDQLQRIYNEMRKSQVNITRDHTVNIPVVETVTRSYNTIGTEPLRKSGYGGELRKSQAPLASADDQLQRIYNDLRKSQVNITRDSDVNVPTQIVSGGGDVRTYSYSTSHVIDSNVSPYSYGEDVKKFGTVLNDVDSALSKYTETTVAREGGYSSYY